jgi:hypothetical protein
MYKYAVLNDNSLNESLEKDKGTDTIGVIALRNNKDKG